VWRTAFLVLLSVSASACDGNSSKTDPAPGHAPQARASEISTAAFPSAAPTASAANALSSASASPAASSAPAASGSVEPPAGSAAAFPVASASNRAASAAAPGSKDGLPKAPRGILAPGAADKILARGAKPIVRLIEPGSAPHAPLLYVLEKTRDRTFGMRVGMSMGLEMGGQEMQSGRIPKMAILFGLGVGEPSAGAHPVDVVLKSISLEPSGTAEQEVAAALRPGLDAMKNLTMRYTVTPKGELRDVRMEFPPSVPAAAREMLKGMNQSLESMVASLPDESVGVGARWRVTGRISSAGADLLQIAVYTLKARSDRQASLDVAIAQLATTAVVNSPHMPPGVTAALRAFKSEGGGTLELDLTQPAPTSGTMTMKSRMEIEAKDTSAQAGAAPERSMIETTVTAEFFRPAETSPPKPAP
jgi:hypothetical protein